MFSSDSWLSNPASGFYPHSINQSLRFEDGDSPYLNRTFSSGNQQTWTWSAWIKRSNIGLSGRSTLFAGRTTGTSNLFGFFNPVNNAAADTFGAYISANEDDRFQTTRVFRDPNAWYHFVVVLDTTNGTAGDRFRLYVNGVRETVWTRFDTITQNQNKGINENLVHTIGEEGSDGNHFDGYMAEVVFLDGVASDPTTLGLGELKDGIWVAKNVSGLTFGTNGFHLDFADSSAIGNDVSGEDHDFAVSGLAATDVVPDSPTNNFAVLQPTAFVNIGGSNSAQTLSEGNLKFTGTSSQGRSTPATIRVTSGKYYVEATKVSGSGSVVMDFVVNDAAVADKSTSTTGDIIIGAVDVDAGKYWSGLNNTWDGSGNPATGANPTGTFTANSSFTFGGRVFDSSRAGVFNFGQDSSFADNKTSGSAGASDANGIGDFYYTPPTNYLTLCSSNLPEPDIIDGSEYFNTVLWTGTGNDDLAVTGVGFSPSWSWMKRRDATGDQLFFDVVRGNGKQLKSAGSTNSPGTSAESTQSNKQKTFTADGFTLGTDATVNTNNGTYVAWNWLAGGSASSNSDGTITSSISANPEAGFSIVSFTHDGTNASTIGHGLGKKPTAIIMKQRSASSNWRVFHSGLADGKNILLNSSNAVTTAGDIFQTAPTNTVFTSGNGDSGSGKTYIAYCFTDIEGYCKAGVYIGNANPDGPYVNLGFRPAFLLIKRSDSASHWVIIDTKRSPSNEITAWLGANLTSSESSLGTNNEFDILSNGFKNRNDAGADIMNQSGASYIYLAFAEQPFKYSNAR